MAIPTWPSGVPYTPEENDYSIEPFLPPVRTEMAGGNVRQRSRPGDNVAIIRQSVRMTLAEYDALNSWGKDTIGRWTGRFKVNVWLGTAFAEKVCQFSEGAPRPVPLNTTHVTVQMTLRANL